MVYTICTVFIVLLLVCILYATLGAILYLLYLPFKNYLIRKNKLTLTNSKKINVLYTLSILLFALYTTYDAFYPSKSFYIQEYKTVTLRELPDSAKFISKYSSYPDLHGDYCSSSQIKLSKEQYQKLLNELSNDKRIKTIDHSVRFEEFTFALREKTHQRIIKSFLREIPNKEDHYLYIGFYDDNETIFINVCIV